MSVYLDVADALHKLRVGLKGGQAWSDDIRLALPINTIRAIIASMPYERMWNCTKDGKTVLKGVELVPLEERSERERQLLAELDNLRRELARKMKMDARSRDCIEAVAQILNAVPLKDTIEAGYSIQTLTDYVVRRLKDV